MYKRVNSFIKPQSIATVIRVPVRNRVQTELGQHWLPRQLAIFAVLFQILCQKWNSWRCE